MNEKETGRYPERLPSRSSRNPAVIAIAVSFFLAIVILIWGHFYGISQVPWPKDRAPVFPVGSYQEASDFFESNKAFSYLGHGSIREEAKVLLNENIPTNPVASLIDTINQKYSGKAAVIDNSPGSLSDSSFNEAFSGLKFSLSASISEQETAIDQMMPWDRETSLEQLAAKKETMSRLEALNSFMTEDRINFAVEFPSGRTVKDFGFVAADNFEGIQENSDGSFSVRAQNARPAFDASFLKKAGVPDGDINEQKLTADEDKLKSVYAEARAVFQTEINQIKQGLAAQRAIERERFYDKWFPVLLMAFVTFFMLWLLLLFFRIIRRKGLPHKSTFEVYFATNMTSIILRWIALAIVALGMAGLVINLLQAIFAAGISMSAMMRFRFVYSLIPSFILRSGYAYALISPIVQTLLTVVAAWGFVLWAEFICFLSNCYHVLFERAYKTDKVESLKIK